MLYFPQIEAKSSALSLFLSCFYQGKNDTDYCARMLILALITIKEKNRLHNVIDHM